MASIATTLLLFILLSLSLQTHARDSQFFTKFTRYLSTAPTFLLTPASAPGLAPGVESPAPAPAEEEFGYGLYGHGSSEFSSGELYSTHEGSNNGTPEKKEKDASYEKLLSGESYYTSNNGYSNNNENGYSSSMSEKYNGYNNNENQYSSYMNENNGYNNNQNRYSSSMNQYNGYNNNDNSMSFENMNNGYNGKGEEESSDQQGLSDTRFMENGKYSYDANNNENDHETTYEEEVSDNGEGYYRNNEDSKYEFDNMELEGQQMGP